MIAQGPSPAVRASAREGTRSAFIGAMAAAVTGVTVVTTDGPGGRLGLTVSAMASVSADPPLLLVAINRRSPLPAAIHANGSFAVNVLGVHQIAVAETFAGRPPAGEPFDFGCARWEPGADGAPLLVDAAARFDCRIDSSTRAGSHALVIGAVRAADRGIARPLAYTRRAYAQSAPLPSRASGAAGAAIRAPARAAGG
jgi:flavin reductase